MTKKDLERKNKFLLLQLKNVNRDIEEIFKTGVTDTHNTSYILGGIEHYTKAETIKKCIENIEYFDEDYNFYDKDMDINEYLD